MIRPTLLVTPEGRAALRVFFGAPVGRAWLAMVLTGTLYLATDSQAALAAAAVAWLGLAITMIRLVADEHAGRHGVGMPPAPTLEEDTTDDRECFEWQRDA